MAEFDFDAVIVGAGAVGLACGYALSRRGLVVAVLEQDAAIGQGVSSRNSEVIHAGLYYPTGSLKARLCVAGRRRLYAFCDAHHVEYDRCGKLVVATTEAELPRLAAILEQARLNDVEGMTELSRDQTLALEPELACAGALLSPESGVFESHAYMLALQGEIEAAGGAVVLSTPFEAATPLETGGFEVRAGGAEPTTLTCRLLVTAPGLSAQAVGGRIEGFPADLIPQAHYGKGVYFRLSGKAPFRRLIYPPPIPGALGTHYRRDLGGQGCSGPTCRTWRRLTTASIRARRASSIATSASSGRGCPRARSVPIMRACGPSCTVRASPSPTSASTARTSTGCPGWWRCSGSRAPA